jgi:hypothetical protein
MPRERWLLAYESQQPAGLRAQARQVDEHDLARTNGVPEREAALALPNDVPDLAPFRELPYPVEDRRGVVLLLGR